MGDRTEWLARSIEEAIDPQRPVCDPHHHLWDYPDSRYLIDEFLTECRGGHRVTDTVYVECRHSYREEGPTELQPVGETEFIDGIASRQKLGEGLPRVARGIIGFADLELGSAVERVLEAHQAASSRFRGIRHMSAWDPSDKVHNAQTDPPQGLLCRPHFQEGFACLERLFELPLGSKRVPQVAEIWSVFIVNSDRFRN